MANVEGSEIHFFPKKRSKIEKKSYFSQKKGIINEKHIFTIGGH